MVWTKLGRAALATGFLALLLTPAAARAQFGGLANRAKHALHPNDAQQKQQNQQSRDNIVPITSANLDAYIRGSRAEQAEAKRLDSLESVSAATPELMRMAAVSRCSAAGAVNLETPAQMHADSVRMLKQMSSIDTVKMKKLAMAAQAGDVTAMAELTQISRNMAKQQMQDPATMARIQQVQKGMEANMKRREACDKSTPPASTFAPRIASAKAEMARYGSRSSPQYDAHLSSVKLAAAGGITPVQYAALEERIRGYMASGTEPERGFSPAELQVLRARRSDLSKLSS